VSELRGSMSHTGGWRGTPFYMSPEAARGENPTPSFDTWALTVVLFEAIAGRRPFDGHGAMEIFERLRAPRIDIRDIRPDCPAGLALFFNRALAIEPGTRPRSARSLTQALESLRTELRVQ
jgi:serine/threonine-protein kinase